ncbi:MAG: lactate racemase domain-containing protein [Verrucomicrobiota bacterium]
MSLPAFPRMMRLRQRFNLPPPVDIAAALEAEWPKVAARIQPGNRIAVAVGSRGITNLQRIVAGVIERVRAAGATPFIVPAMGSHGGATPQGQMELLAEYGITEQALGVPIHAAMEAEQIGATDDGVAVYFSAVARPADGVIVVNRIKPHTDFSGTLGSGILKMMVIGLGKRMGAANFHLSACRLGYEHVLRTSARVTLRSTPILCGVAIVENQAHQTARLEILLPTNLEARETELFAEAKQLMPKLPFNDMDLLIVDRIGKNISGSGLDPNVVGRSVHGYSSLLADASRMAPAIRRLFVRDLTPETHGNAIGIGMADVTTARLVQSINRDVTAINALTALTPQAAKMPIHFPTDRDAIAAALRSVFPDGFAQAKVVRIADTLSLEHIEASEAYTPELAGRADLEAMGEPEVMGFDAAGNLPEIGVA